VPGAGEQAPVVMGVEYQQESGDVTALLDFGLFSAPANFRLERTTRSIFGEARVRPHPSLHVQGGLRVDDVDRHGTHTSVLLGIQHLMPGIGSALGATYGTGFKPPSFFALGHPIVGNRQLRPEESKTMELALASDPAYPRRLGWRFTLFRSEFTDLVDFDAGPPPRLVNRSHVEIDGAEAAASIKAGERLSLRTAATWLSYDLPAGEGPLRNRPRFKATAGADVKLAQAIGANVRAAWIGKTFDSSIPTGRVELASFLLVDAALTYTARDARVTLAIDNLLDRDYEEFIGFPSRGRRARIEVAFDL
jgi:vitamin B12 transporter